MIGTHLLADLYGVESERLEDSELLRGALCEAAERCRLTPLGAPLIHRFDEGGVTGVILLSESHIALHTYPEHRYMALDIFSCGEGSIEEALEVFCAALNPADVRVTTTARGTEI